MSELAPIGLTTYSRLGHLKQAVAALQKNTLATQSILHIFSDGPKPGDERTVEELRAYLRTIEGFRTVKIFERERNDRATNNRSGIKFLLKEYGKMIWLADDVVTAPGYLAFMNEALRAYRDVENVVSVCGYCPPIEIPADYPYDAFFLRRFCAWGLGMWGNGHEIITPRLDMQEYRRNLKDRNFCKKLVENGADLPGMLELDATGAIDAGDVRVMYRQVLNDWYTVYPRHSLVQNIGHDGSGMHCGVTDRFTHDSLWTKGQDFRIPEQLRVDPRIVAANRAFRNRGYNYQRRMINLLSRFGLYAFVRNVWRKLRSLMLAKFHNGPVRR